MASGPQLSFGRSAFDAFLFATVGEDKAGTELTVLSALARLGLDPWNEAARLADMPRAAAVLALGKTIALLPLGNWKEADSSDIATRLVGQLPAAGTPIVASPAGAGLVHTGLAHTGLAQLASMVKLPTAGWLTSRSTVVLVCAVLAIGWFYVLTNYEKSPPFESAPTTQQ